VGLFVLFFCLGFLVLVFGRRIEIVLSLNVLFLFLVVVFFFELCFGWFGAAYVSIG